MARVRQAQVKPFVFKKFSEKAQQAMLWWHPDYATSKHDGIVCDGSIRAAKTISVICGFLEWSMYMFKGQGQNFAICGKTLPVLNKNVITEMYKILCAWGIPVLESRDPLLGQYLVIATNKYFLYEYNNEQSFTKIQGITLAGILIDEAPLAPRSFVEMALSRLSIEGSKFWFTGNPAMPKHYVKTEIIDKAKEKNYFHLHFTMDDNLSLSESIKEKYRRQYTGVFYKRYILGLWVGAEGLVYDCFDEEKHLCDMPKPEDIRQVIVSCDYGTTNPTCFIAFAVLANRKVVAISEYYYSSEASGGRRKTDMEYAEDLAKFCRALPKKVNEIIIDPSAASFKLQAKKTLTANHIPIAIFDADNEVLDGIRTQASMLVSGTYQIVRTLTHNIGDYYLYMWDAKATERGMDEVIKQDDHTKDAERYGLKRISKILKINYAAFK